MSAAKTLEEVTIADKEFVVTRTRGIVSFTCAEPVCVIRYTEAVYKARRDWVLSHVEVALSEHEAEVAKVAEEREREEQSQNVGPFEGHEEILKQVEDEKNMPHVALVAKRAWNLNMFDKRLTSVNDGDVWPANETYVARCTATHQSSDSHPSPVKGCSCGIYAVREDIRLGSIVNTNNAVSGMQLVGEVYLWGRILHGLNGYKAEKAYPKRFFTPPDKEGNIPWVAQAFADEYGVPIELMDSVTLQEF